MKFLKYLVLFCKDTEKSKEWYERIGFNHLRGFDGMHWFQISEVEIMLHPTDNKNDSGDAQFHILVDDVNLIFNLVKKAGFQPVDYQKMKIVSEPVGRLWGTDFGLVDPDGYIWVFMQEWN